VVNDETFGWDFSKISKDRPSPKTISENISFDVRFY
jgi:hypothetical protein